MTRLRIQERLNRKRTIAKWIILEDLAAPESDESEDEGSSDVDDDKDDAEFLAFLAGSMATYHMCRYAVDDVPTPVFRRDVLGYLSYEDCMKKLRFNQEEILFMYKALGLPEVIRTPSRYKLSGVNALCLTLNRLAFPNTLQSTRIGFGVGESHACEVFNTMLVWLDEHWGHLLEKIDWDRVKPRLQEFAAAIHASGAPLEYCFGFIDGTVRPIARPVRYQRANFNGHKRVHAKKWQGVVTPDGTIVQLDGPYDGNRHDAHMATSSGVVPGMASHAVDPDGQAFYLYGDAAYGLNTHIQGPYQSHIDGDLTAEMVAHNKAMSCSRITVEWAFKEITSRFAFVSMKSQQKSLLSRVDLQFKTSALFTNIRNCMKANQISKYFGVAPPAVLEYLRE